MNNQVAHSLTGGMNSKDAEFFFYWRIGFIGKIHFSF